MKQFAIVFLLYALAIAGAQLDSDEARRCQSVVTAQHCNGGLNQEAANIAMRCNQLQAAQDLQELCLTNSNGLLCGLAITFLERVQSVPSVCENASILCTPECRALLMGLRSELGCCISETYNQTTDTTTSFPDSFDFSLWSSCGVELVDGCPADSSFELQAIPVDPSCTNSDYLEMLGANSCASRFVGPILDELSATNGCDEFSEILQEQCGAVSETGRPCYELQIPLVSGLTSTAADCTDTTTCDPSCRTTLESFADLGCCVNSAFNSTAAEAFGLSHDFLSNEFFSLCGLETIGRCEVRDINSATALYQAATVTIALLLLYVHLFF